MAKKMYDILPPKPVSGAKKATKGTVVDVTALAQVRPKPLKKAKSYQGEAIYNHDVLPKETKKFPLKEVWVGAVILLVVLGVYGYMKLPKADIHIWPKVAVLDFSQKVTAATSVKAVSMEANTIPAQYVEIQKELQQEFPATGISSQDGKATGTITIYNKINPSTPFTLIKGTHFLSDSGKYFITLAKVTIPAAKNKVPGSINVQVQAEQAGDEYNIKAAKFSIPKLNGTSYYYSVYGESTSKMEGGYTGKVKKVTDDDIQTAKQVVVKKLLAEAENALTSGLSEDQVLLNGTLITQVVESSANVSPNAVSDNFIQKATVKASALVFKKHDVDEFIKKYIVSRLPDNHHFIEKNITINYQVESFDQKAEKLSLTLKFNADTYPNINTDALIDLVSMKSSVQIKEVIDQMHPGKVSQLEVDFWPFWVKKAPSDTKRIKVDLQFNE